MDGVLSVARFSELIGLIYDCAISPEKWPVAMEAIRQQLDCELSSLNLQIFPSGRSIVNITTNLAPEYVQVMARSGPAVVEQWGGEHVLRALPLHEPAIFTRVNPSFDRATTTNAYWHEFAEPQGLIDVLALGLARDARALGSLSFGRHARAGPFGEREIGLARLLIPHVQRAAAINRLLDQANTEREYLVDTLDALAVPVLMVGEDLELIHANQAATSLLDRQELVAARGGKLHVFGAEAFEAAVKSASEAAAEPKTAMRGIPLRTSGGATGTVFVAPLVRANAGRSEGAIVGVFVSDARVSFTPRSDIATILFDLTKGEARVFDCLASGDTLKEAAASLGVAVSTVKTHMLNLYQKLGVGTRAELIRVAAALTAPVLC